MLGYSDHTPDHLPPSLPPSACVCVRARAERLRIKWHLVLNGTLPRTPPHPTPPLLSFHHQQKKKIKIGPIQKEIVKARASRRAGGIFIPPPL